MASILLTESGDRLIAEPAAGIPSASSLNDTTQSAITKDTFDENPEANGYLLGTGVSWDAVNKRLNF